MPLPTELGTVIARRRMRFVKDGVRRDIEVLIGQPMPDPLSDHGDCFCPAQVRGLTDRDEVMATSGIDGIQALSLTFAYLDTILQEQAGALGGRLVYDDDDVGDGPYPWLGPRPRSDLPPPAEES